MSWVLGPDIECTLAMLKEAQALEQPLQLNPSAVKPFAEVACA